MLLDLILAAMVMEGLALAGIYVWRGRGLAPAAFLPTLLAGMGLLLAMRLALTHGWWGLAPAALLAALVFHVADLAGRWR